MLVRADLEWGGRNSPRELATREIIKHLRRKGAGRIKIIGHKGNIGMVTLLGEDMNWDLRADPREETNAGSLARELAVGFDIYVNEAFATSHRRHASIDALPRLMKGEGKQVTGGLRFEKEIEILDKIQDSIRQWPDTAPKVLVIGGAKSGDKAKYADELESQGWVVLRGGLLPGAKLRLDGLDISDETIINYQLSIIKAGTIVVAGPMGKYEVDNADHGTKEVFTAAANSGAFKVAGGGDTEAAIERFRLKGKFDWISVGGGAMLEYLSSGTLSGIEALAV